jgi:O-antigen/teichoic acid export membrane protein
VSTKIQLILKGSSFRVLQTFISIVIGLVMMPFLISTLGKEMYGLWLVISSVVTSYYLLDLGFNQAVTRYVAKYIHQKDSESANKVINTALLLYSSLGGILFAISIIAAYFGADSLMDKSNQLTLAQTVLIISGLSIALEFPAKAFPGIISAYMRFDVIATVRFTKSIIDAALIYLAVSNGYGLVAMALITFMTGILSTLIYVRYSTSLFKELTFSKAHIDKKTFKSIFHFSKWVFIFDLSAVIRDKMDIWLIAFYLGNITLPVYYVAVRLVDYAMSFLQQATGMSGPIFTEYYVKGQFDSLNRSFSVFIKSNVVLGVTVIVGFYQLGYSFIDSWMKGAVSTEIAFNCLIVLSVGRFMVYFTTPVQSLLMTINKHKIGAWIALFETVLAAALSLWLIPKYELIGAAFAIATPYVIGRLFILPVFVTKHIDTNLKSLALRVATFILLSVAHAILLREYIPNVLSLTHTEIFGFGILIIFIQLCISFIIWNQEERDWIINFLKSKLSA